MKKLCLIVAVVTTIAASAPHSLPARSNPMMALGILGVGGFGYKFLGAWQEMQSLKEQLEEFPSPRNKAAYEEAREEFMEVKAQLGKTRLRLVLHALGTLASAALLAKGFSGTGNNTDSSGKTLFSGKRGKLSPQVTTQLTLQEQIQQEKENNRTRGFNDSEATINLLQSALNTDASINPGHVDQLITHVDPFAHERSYGTDQNNARTTLGGITLAQLKKHSQAFRQLIAKITPQAHRDFVETQSAQNHYFWENTPLYKAAILEDEEAVDILLNHDVAYDRLTDRYQQTLLFKLAADYEKAGDIAKRTRIIQKILDKYPSLLTHKDFGDFIYQKAEKAASALRPWIDPRSSLMDQMRAPFQAEQQKKEVAKSQEDARELLRTVQFADQISAADVRKYRELGGNEEQLQAILHKKFMEATNYFTRIDAAKAQALIALGRSPLTTKEQETLDTNLEFALKTSKYEMAAQLHSLGARLSEARQQFHLFHLIMKISPLNSIKSVANVQSVVDKLGINVNAKNEKGKTALMELVEKDFSHAVSDIIQLNGVDVNIPDNDGNTALVLAMQHATRSMTLSTKEIISILLQRAAAIDTKMQELAPQVVVAGYAVLPEFGEDLRTAFANKGISVDISKMTPQELLTIKEKKGISAVYNLLKASAPLTSEIKPIAADLFVYALSSKQDFDVATILLSHIYDMNEADNREQLPLVAAIKSGQSDLEKAAALVKAIMKKKANVNMPEHNNTALIAALSIAVPSDSDDGKLEYDTSMLSLLLGTYKADPNVATIAGNRTPLSVAAINGNVKAVEILLAHNADVNRPAGAFKNTPLHRALIPKHDNQYFAGSYSEILAIAEKLIAAGADKDALNKDGKTPYDTAIVNKDFLDQKAQEEGKADASELFALLNPTAGE